MTSDEPWADYTRDKLPHGWAYPLGRDEVSAALVSARVRLGSLSFSRTDTRNFDGRMVLHSYWPSDARPKYFGSGESGRSPLIMWVSAVPSAMRLQLGNELREVWLQQVVAWAAKVPTRGNAWKASDHYWILRYVAGAGLVLEDE